jgi:hypothetical protein
MVDFKSISLEELSALVNRYPWFAAARKELCVRTGQYADAALYVFDRGILAEQARKGAPSGKEASEYLRERSQAPMEQKVVVVGGDYFSQEAYDSVRTAQVDPSAAPQDDRPKKELEDVFITEPLAEIYATQGYLEQAKEIYSKLILRYPEKSAYFATLIEKLNNINNQ